MDFTANDAGGNPVTLSQVMKRSRYLLLDFWFADCVPCRSEMPHIRTAYEAYHDKGIRSRRAVAGQRRRGMEKSHRRRRDGVD